MDDLTFRKRIYADPNDNNQDIIDACNDDKSKAKFKSEMKAFDLQLQQALNVKVPDNLAEKVLLSQSIHSQNKVKKRTKIHLALAASVALFVGVISTNFGLTSTYNTVGEYALAHNIAEIKHAHPHAHDAYSVAQVNSKISEFGGEIIDSVPDVSFVMTCYFAHIKSLHMVFQGEDYPVTVFMIPKETGLEETPFFSDDQFNGRTIEINNSKLLIITDKNDTKTDWINELTTSIKWDSV